MKILITGGAGFIGSHTADALLNAGHTVRILDNLHTGSLDNIPAGAQFVQGDITNGETANVAAQGCDAILHLAALVSVPQSLSQPVETFQVNTVGTINMLEAARTNGVKRFMLASTCAIYGSSAGRKGEDSPVDPLVPYASSKLMAEEAGRSYAAAFGLEFVAVRYFNVYGPRQRADSPYSGVVARWCDAAKANKPCLVFGDGEQTRDFVSVYDVARANARMATTPIAELSHRLYNVGTGQSVSLNTLLQSLGEAAGSGAVTVEYREARAGDIRESAGVADRLRGLGWRPSVSLVDGLRELVIGR